MVTEALDVNVIANFQLFSLLNVKITGIEKGLGEGVGSVGGLDNVY